MDTVDRVRSEGAAAGGERKERTVDEIIRLLPELGKAVQSIVPDSVLREGVSPAQVKAIVYLAEHGSQTMGDLAAGLDITTPSATGLINPLADAGLVLRERSAQDRRVVFVDLSDDARHMADEILQERQAELRAALEGLGDSVQEDMLRGLQRMSDHFGSQQRHPRGIVRRVSRRRRPPSAE